MLCRLVLNDALNHFAIATAISAARVTLPPVALSTSATSVLPAAECHGWVRVGAVARCALPPAGN